MGQEIESQDHKIKLDDYVGFLLLICDYVALVNLVNRFKVQFRPGFSSLGQKEHGFEAWGSFC
jgi:hypothetical protein